MTVAEGPNLRWLAARSDRSTRQLLLAGYPWPEAGCFAPITASACLSPCLISGDGSKSSASAPLSTSDNIDLALQSGLASRLPAAGTLVPSVLEELFCDLDCSRL